MGPVPFRRLAGIAEFVPPGPDMGVLEVDLVMERDTDDAVEDIGQFVADIVDGCRIGRVPVAIRKVVALEGEHPLGQVTDLFRQFDHAGFHRPRPALHLFEGGDRLAGLGDHFVERM